MAGPSGLKQFLREKELWILTLLGIVYCRRPLIFQETFYYRDLHSFFLPKRQALLNLIHSGELPLWNPWLHGGSPFLADISADILYPSNLLYLLLPLRWAFNLDLALHLCLCSAFAYLLARTLGLSRASSFVTGALYGFCGYMLSFLNLFHRLTAMPYVPLLLLSWHLYLQSRNSRYFLVAAIAGTFQFLTGATEMCLLTYCFLLGWTLFYPYTHPRPRRLIITLALLVFIGALSAIQVIPTLELALQSSRRAQDLLSGVWSVHPKRFPEFLLPGFFGFTDTLIPGSYWGQAIEYVPFSYILSIYFGLPVLILIAAAWPAQQNALPLQTRRYLFVILLLSVILSVGQYLPFSSVLATVFFPATWFRYPVKILATGLLPAALLAGAGVQCMLEENRKPDKRILFFSSLLVVLPAALLGGFAMSPAFANSFQDSFFQNHNETIRHGLIQSLSHALLFAGLAALLLYLRNRNLSAAWKWGMGILVAADLILAGARLNPVMPWKFLTDVPPQVQSIRTEVGRQRLFRDETPQQFALTAPTTDAYWHAVWNIRILNYYLPLYFGIPTIFDYDYEQLTPKRLALLKKDLGKYPWENRLPVLSAGAASLILTSDEIPPMEALERLAVIRGAGSLTFYLYRIRNPAPRVGFVSDVIAVDSEEQARMAMIHPRFDPVRQVVLVRPAEGTGPCAGSAVVNELSFGARNSRHRIVAPCNGYAVFAEPYYPGWKIRIDGKDIAALPANVAFTAVPLPAGTHEVERSYEPLSVIAGATITIVAFLLLILMTRKKIL